MKPVFLDTVGLIALWDSADQWHRDADAAFARMVTSHAAYVTTPQILMECGNAAARKPYRTRVVALKQMLEAGGGLVDPTDAELQQAWRDYERGRPGDPGIVDCVSFAVMRRLGLVDAFTNDQHFKAAGFNPLF